jgi:hypothetical protein
VDRGLEHHRRVGEQVDALGRAEGVVVVLAVLIPELLHDAVHFLTLTRHAEAREEPLQRVHEGETREVEGVHVGVENFLVQLYILTQIVSYASLI